MAKSEIERAIEKQQRETKRMAEQEARRQRASAIVNGQPFIGGMRMIDQAAEEILKIILDHYDGNEQRRVFCNDNAIPEAYIFSLPLEFEKLTMYGMIGSHCVWLGNTCEMTLTPQGISYFEDKNAAQERDRMDREKAGSINIGSLTSHGGNIFLAPVTNSTFSIDNSVSNIEKEIEEKAGEDAEELKAVLDEVKELIENINDSRHIPKNRGLLQRITGHLDKHGWFYAEIIGLLGTAAMALLGG